MKQLPLAIQCPSVGAVSSFTHSDCNGSRCEWWEHGKCGARILTERQFAEKMKALPPPCGLASSCRWDIEALAEGRAACAVRLMGMICEHQGGEWNTFNMADPMDWED